MIEEYQRRRQRQRPARAALTLKSHLLQEAEAVARLAKREWCAANGVTVAGLQHDGIFITSLPDGLGMEDVAEQLGMAASRSTGYRDDRD
eukprot:1273377-Prymnesium_polylepis.1